jgi:hypothetical protein
MQPLGRESVRLAIKITASPKAETGRVDARTSGGQRDGHGPGAAFDPGLLYNAMIDVRKRIPGFTWLQRDAKSPAVMRMQVLMPSARRLVAVVALTR